MIKYSSIIKPIYYLKSFMVAKTHIRIDVFVYVGIHSLSVHLPTN